MSETLNLDERMLAIMHDLGGLEKTGTAHRSVGGYAYHAIDEIEAHLRPLLIKHGVTCWVSEVEAQSVQIETSGGKSAQQTDMKLTVTFRNADDPKDFISVQTYGQGIDTSDKAAGKAMSYALKNLYLALFHMRGQDDVEAGKPQERVSAPTTRPGMTVSEADTIKLYVAEIKARTAEDDEEAKVHLGRASFALKQGGKLPREKTESLIRQLSDFLKGLKSEEPVTDHPEGMPGIKA